MLSESTTTIHTYNVAEVGLERLYKAVTFGRAISDAPAQTIVATANSLRPLSPVQISGSRDGSENLTITWTRRARINAGWRDDVDVPLDEASEAYEVDILNGGAVVRTLTASTASAGYTAAQQTTDFGSTQSAVEIRVYQMSEIVGRGHAAEATV